MMANTGRSESRKFPIAIWIFGILSFFGFFSWINANLPSTKDQAEKLDKTEIDTQIVKTSPEPSLEPEPSFSPKSIFFEVKNIGNATAYNITFEPVNGFVFPTGLSSGVAPWRGLVGTSTS